MIGIMGIGAGIFCGENNPQSHQYWVFFKDKPNCEENLEKALRNPSLLDISQRALLRRLKVRNRNRLIDKSDLPVSEDYIQIIQDYDLEVQFVSRWLNCIRVRIPFEKLEQIRSLPFVRKVSRISRIKKITIPSKPIGSMEMQKSFVQHRLDYGLSEFQNSQIGIPEVHDLGLTGKNILIGLIDNGFDFKDRSVFKHLDVYEEYDFHWNDYNTANESGDPSDQHNHGTSVLSIIGGYDEGQFIGTAFDASFVLAKTEWNGTTDAWFEVENWVRAIEWMESLGCDVVSSSLGYYTFVDTADYTHDDLDGNTCIATIAADIATSKGVVVLTSAGNERNKSWKYITFPADGDSVIAVGAVDYYGNLAYFSSTGPTADGRIKPDVVAMGLGTVCLNPTSGYRSDYYYTNGTSLSAPLAAGVCALILQAHPELNPIEVRDALRNTANRAELPDTLYGWGLINAYKAIFYHGMIFNQFQKVGHPLDDLEGFEIVVFSNSGINPDSAYLYYRSFSTSDFQKLRMTATREDQGTRFFVILPQKTSVDDIEFYLSIQDTLGFNHIGPVGAPHLLYSFSDTSTEIVTIDLENPVKYHLYQNFPNPFNNSTIIEFELEYPLHVNMSIFNINGQRIKNLIDEDLNVGKKRLIWTGRDQNGLRAPSGIYFCVLNIEGVQLVRKMILIR